MCGAEKWGVVYSILFYFIILLFCFFSRYTFGWWGRVKVCKRAGTVGGLDFEGEAEGE